MVPIVRGKSLRRPEVKRLGRCCCLCAVVVLLLLSMLCLQLLLFLPEFEVQILTPMAEYLDIGHDL